MVRECPMCGTENKEFWRMGVVIHFCCRACGWWYYFTARKRPERQDSP